MIDFCQMSRLYALDLARFIAMLLMIQGHVLDALVLPTVIDVTQPPWNVWGWIRGLTAPVFLTVSGAVHVFAAKRAADGMITETTLERRMRWAVTILVIGYLLVFPGKRIIDLPYVAIEGWRTFFAVNILQLVGVAMIAFVSVMQTTRSVADMGRRAMITSALILLCSPLVHLEAVHAHMPMWLRPYLTSQYGSLFPFFPFATYLFLGVVIGARLHAIAAEDRDAELLRLGTRIGLPLALLGYGLLYGLVAMGVPQRSIDNADSILLVAARFGVVLVIFAGAVKLLKITWRLRSAYILFGSKSLYIYVIHVILLFGSPWWDGIGRTKAKSLELSEGLLALVIIVSLTLLMAWMIDRYQRAAIPDSRRQVIRRALLMVLIVTFSIAW
ncbi:MAG: hypothetical protein RIR53_385 [Bacteroidota bacterium]|jgi:uncharacterized membrane protein